MTKICVKSRTKSS